MYELFGARQVDAGVDDGLVEFTLFFPDRLKDPAQYLPERKDESGKLVSDFGQPQIASIQVAGSFQSQLGGTAWDWANAPHLRIDPTHAASAKGTVWTYRTPQKLKKGFYEYKYLVAFQNGDTRVISDPCTKYGGKENQNAAIAVGGSDPPVSSLDGRRKPLRELIQYETNIDDFTDEFRGDRAPLDAVIDKLDYLANELKVNAIAFLPWTAWPGQEFSWGYTPYLYFSVEYRLANALKQPEDKLAWLKKLVNECHARGIHVIMDGVFNHVGADLGSANPYGYPYPWFYQNPKACPYVGTFGGTFTGLADLDFNNGCTQEFIRDACLYWIDEFKIDGIRFDNTVNFYVPEISDKGLPQLLADITAHNKKQGHENFSLILEHIDVSAARITNETCANSFWNEALYEATFDGLWNKRITPKLMASLNTHKYLDEVGKVATTYLTQHDHSCVAWQAGATENQGGMQWYRTQPYAVALLTAPGSILIQNGQEFAEDHWLMGDDQGSGRRVQPRPLRWRFQNDNIGQKLLTVYQKLIDIRKTYPGLNSDYIYPGDWEEWQKKFDPHGYGIDVDRNLMIFHRWGEDGGKTQRFIIALNFSAEDQHVDIPFPVDGPWQELLEDVPAHVAGYWLHNQKINSHWGKIFYHE
jgi:1,4-alpha-glucan branching enzyme